MSRRWIWTAFWAAGLVLLGALLWVTDDLLDANRQARYESDLRAALWRMDSQVGVLLARERERDPAQYKPFPEVQQQAYAKSDFKKLQQQELLTSSNLLTFKPDYVRFHFEIDQQGEISSPQVPRGASQEQAVPDLISQKTYIANCDMLEGVQNDIDPAKLGLELKQVQQRGVNRKKGKGRQWLASNSVAPGPVTVGEFDPVWIRDNLYFVRTVKQGATKSLQSFLIDWPQLRQSLLGEIDDLFPAAALEAYEGDSEDRALFTLPARLVPGAMAHAQTWSMEHWVLAVLWALVVGAFVAFGATLRRSERQRRFAGHVTHELRSPLTTFSLYSDLLAEGLVQDRDKQIEYMQTLQSESRRMNHMIENVIAQARLEEGRARMHTEAVSLRRVLEETQAAVQHTCERAGMQLSFDAGDAADTLLRVDRAAVGRIITNLVENACKYAAPGDPPVLSVTASLRDGALRLRVRDHGPGVTASQVRRIFHLYDRGGRDETDDVRGLGLGLPLSRGLARQLGGDLSYETPSDGKGACFVLTLPLE